MFDLFRSRDKAVRILLAALLGLVGLSMVTYLIPGQGTTYDTSPGSTQVLATVGKTDLTNQEVSKIVQKMTRDRQMPPELLSIYVPQIVQQMISDRALEYEAARLGMKVSPEETENAIFDTLPPELVKGGKVDSTILTAVLAQQGMTLPQLKIDTARQLLITRLKQMVIEGVVVSPAEIEKEFHRKADKIKLQYVMINGDKFRAEAEPSEAEIKSYYDAHKAIFTTPEKRSMGIVVLDPMKVGLMVPATDADLRREYNTSQEQFRTPERVQVRHILVKSDASNDAAMKTKAEGVLKQIQAGGDFATLAKANSDDPGSGAQGGELGFIVKGQTVPEFEKSAFSLQVGQTSGLVKTTYGYHILQVEKHEQAHLQTLDEAKPQLLSQFSRRMANEQMQKLSDKIVAELHKDPLHPEKAAAAANAALFVATNVASGDPYPGVGVSKEFSDAVAALRKGEVTAGPVVLQDGKVALASVTDYQAARASTFEEARSDARNKAGQDKLQAIVDKKAADLIAKAKETGDLEKAAKSMGLDVKTSEEVDRQGAIEGVGSAATFNESFDKPLNAIVGPLPMGANKVIAKTVAKIPADLAGLATQRAGIRDEIKQQKERDRAQLFEDGLKKRLEAEGKLKVHQDLITQLVKTYTARS